jgi:hypothetical protein
MTLEQTIIDIAIYQGATFRALYIVYEDEKREILLDLSDYTAKAQIKEHPESVNPLFEFDVDIIPIDSTGIPYGIMVTMPAERSLNIKANRYVYDIMLTSISVPEEVIRPFRGQVSIEGSITR